MASIMRKMNIISRSELMYRSEKSSVGLHGLYHSYVLAVCHNPGKSQDWLSKHMAINKSSVARHLATMEKDGYIERKPSTLDRRELLVFPTEKMFEVKDEVLAITTRWNRLLAEGITEEELKVFHEILDKMLVASQEILYGGGDEK